MRCCKCCPWLKDVQESMECALLQLQLRAYCFFPFTFAALVPGGAEAGCSGLQAKG